MQIAPHSLASTGLRLSRKLRQKFRRRQTHNSYSNWFISPERMAGGWIERFCIHHDIPPMHWISCFGAKHAIPYSNRTANVFFGPENLDDRFTDYNDYLLPNVELSIGFSHLNASNYLRFPLWLMYFTEPDMHSPGATFVNMMQRQWNLNRPYFCAQVASHDDRGNGRGLRTKITTELQSIGEIMNCGRLLNNSNLLQRKYYGNNINLLLRDFQFNICFENGKGDGYVTEKLFQALINGCIPIYWGNDNPEEQVLSPGSFIAYDPLSPDSCISAVRELHENEKLRKEFANYPKVTEGAADWINGKHQELKEKLLSISS